MSGISSSKMEQTINMGEDDRDEDEKRDLIDILYKNILKDVRNMNVLTSYQIHYLRTIPADKLVYIIGVYNKVMRNVNDLL